MRFSLERTHIIFSLNLYLAPEKELQDFHFFTVVKALVGKYGITASGLQPFGAGPVAPVISNQSEEGRAKNRRVELVKQ